MTAKLVIRVLDADNQLLGWTEHQALVKGDGCLRAAGPVTMLMDRAGQPAIVSTHWCEVHIETRVPWPGGPVRAGGSAVVFQKGAAIVTLGTPPVGLPPVTLRAEVAVSVPTGTLGAVGTRL